jgi:hypothetical protein
MMNIVQAGVREHRKADHLELSTKLTIYQRSYNRVVDDSTAALVNQQQPPLAPVVPMKLVVVKSAIVNHP